MKIQQFWLAVCICFLLRPAVNWSQKITVTEYNRLEKQSKRVTIIRDNWGIAHIYGKTDADAVLLGPIAKPFEPVCISFSRSV